MNQMTNIIELKYDFADDDFYIYIENKELLNGNNRNKKYERFYVYIEDIGDN